jgi:Sulfotransferase family
MVEQVPEATPAPPTIAKTTTTLFVVGIFRSGTSLLYALLNQHPDIALMYECDVWNFPRALSGPRFRHDWRERLEFYTNALSRHHLVARDDVCGLENVNTPQDLYRAFAKTRSARIIGEKSPFYCDHLRELAENHPGASFILIWRNPVEIYSSVRDSARDSRYFRRPGMLSRLVYYQEEMICGAAELTRLGSRIHHVSYADLIDHTEDCCRGICGFLDIEFDERMTNLAGADLSAVFRAPHFEHLRLGKIGRRQANRQTDPGIVQKLQRFHNRWSRLRRESLNLQLNAEAGREAGTFERVYHYFAGWLLCGMDGAIRVGFEFLPLPWLRTYRQAKLWFNEGCPPQEQRLSMCQEFAAHQATVLVINRRWGTLAAALSALVWGFLQNVDNSMVNLKQPGVWLWDAFMRFLVVEIVVLLLDRIRIEIRTKKRLHD